MSLKYEPSSEPRFHLFTAAEAIGYVRVMRPGSIIGPQQQFLEQLQGPLHALHRADNASPVAAGTSLSQIGCAHPPQPETRNPEPETRNPEPETRNPRSKTTLPRNPRAAANLPSKIDDNNMALGAGIDDRLPA